MLSTKQRLRVIAEFQRKVFGSAERRVALQRRRMPGRVVELRHDRAKVVRMPPSPAGLFSEFSARDDRATLHRVVDATERNTHRPELPGEETAARVRRVLTSNPYVGAAALRVAKVGVGAGVGAHLGYRTRGRAGIKPGAKAGAIAGLLFQTPEVALSAMTGVARAAEVELSRK